MDNVRKGLIALLFLKHQLREKGARLTPNLKSEIENGAKAIGISLEEATESIESVVRELIEETITRTNKG